MVASTPPSRPHTHLQGTVGLFSSTLQPLLDGVQAAVLVEKPVQLVAQLRLPEANVRQPLAQVPAGPLLHLTGQLVLVLHELQGVPCQPASPQPRGLGPTHLQLIGPVPVMGAVATEERRVEHRQGDGWLHRAVACGSLVQAGLGIGDLVEEAGSP